MLVYYSAKDPIEGNWYTFDETVYAQATLYVPAEAVNKCRQIDPWRNFLRIDAYEFDGIKDVETDIDNNQPCDVYTLGGMRVATSTEGLAPGIYILRQGDKAKKIAVQ